MRLSILVLTIASCVSAETPSEPPTLIRLIRDHAGAADALARGYGEARAETTVLGMTAITGSGENWLVEAFDSFAGLEDLDRALNALTQPALTPDAPAKTLLLYQPALSYRPDQAMRLLPKARYFYASIFQIKPGSDADFAELVKLRRLGYDSINLDRPEIAYHLLSGGPAGTYVFLAPLTSLRAFDNGLAKTPAYAEAVVESGAKSGRKIAADIELIREHYLLRTMPQLSYVPDEFAMENPEFWGSRPKK